MIANLMQRYGFSFANIEYLDLFFDFDATHFHIDATSCHPFKTALLFNNLPLISLRALIVMRN